jgi:hypothetical protein
VQITPNVEGALTFQAGMHQSSAVNTDSFATTACKSMALKEAVMATDATTTGAVAVGSWTQVEAVSAVGMGSFVKDAASTPLYVPVINANDSTTAVVPAMDLKTAPATSPGEIIRASTIYPGSPAAASTWITFEHQSQGAGSSNKFEGLARGCSLASIAAFEIVPNVFPFLNFTFNAATIESGTVTSLAANDFRDSANLKPVDPATFYCEYATANTSGGITRAIIPIIKATVDLGWSSKPIPGVGGATCPGGIQGHFGGPTDEGPTIMLEMIWDIQQVTDWEASTVEKHIALVQPSSSKANLGWSFTAPSCRIIEQPVIDHYAEGYRKVTAKYRMGPAGFGSDTLDSETGNQPWYWILPTSEQA